MEKEWNEAAHILAQGGVGVIPTDTLYGLVALTTDTPAVMRVRVLKERDEKKALIVLIPSIEAITSFGIVLSPAQKSFMDSVWPGKVSIVFSCPNEELEYISGSEQSIAFRLPDDERLKKLLEEIGPIVAPSANPQGMSPATTIDQAKKYFGENVDFYINGQQREGKPSTVVSVDEKGEVKIIRHGAVKI